ncbi:MAG TPA: RNA methyltransferase [bacterium]|nr:RNA methyltransferase [bacterium]
MDRDITALLSEHLGSFITSHKRDIIERVLDHRTDRLALVLEDIYQPHNASATIRTCECYGIQNIHIIENRNRYEVNPDVVMGSVKWVTLHRYRTPEADNTAACIAQLREQGYRIIATTPHKEGHTPDNLSLDRPVALLFGTEEQGLTSGALAAADTTLRIPMFGFTESLNISVSVAVTFSHLVRRLHAEREDWRLNDDRRAALRLLWYRRIVKKSELIEEEFLRSRGIQRPADIS